jgi:hypothetical protein
MPARHDFRIPRSSVAGKSNGALFWALIQTVWQEAHCDLTARLADATPGQCSLFVLTLFIREVDNGGLEQFFWNSSGDLYEEVIVGFSRIGAENRAAAVRKATEFFHAESSFVGQAERRKLLSRASKSDKDVLCLNPPDNSRP